MALEQKIEAVKKVGEALNKQQPQIHEELERVAPNKEHFQNFLNTSSTIQPSFQRLDGSVVAPEQAHSVENPIFGDENVTVQGNGTATDQENKKKKQLQKDEIEGVVATTNKKVTSSSLIEEVGKLNTKVAKISTLTPEELRNQAQSVIAQIDQVKTQLSQTQAEIKPSYQNLLRNRLTHIDDNLKIALSKAGVEYTPPAAQVTDINSPNPIKRFIGYLTSSQYQLEHLNQTIEHLNLTKVQMTPASMLAIQIKVGYIQQQIELFTSLLNKALESTKTIMNVQV
ncbi:Uncharacterized protein PRO82_001417 [Candidatus Protochlamydia amoebophila]|uniref:hypothetical protein n=1 Tax=Candidatus Protochlamydia amoebophila TaxID=362787 RepID=UPI001BC8F3FF|nr:hypothetical protein [Candidatus Protochlamydia amoebophila]MBS4164101.1 Uncharacterized protein [Candidatus Protochlamydia amoebophila]